MTVPRLEFRQIKLFGGSLFGFLLKASLRLFFLFVYISVTLAFASNAGARETQTAWSKRRDRTAISGSFEESSPEQECRNFLKTVTTRDANTRTRVRQGLNNHDGVLPQDIKKEIERFCTLSPTGRTGREFEALASIISSLASRHSITELVPFPLAEFLSKSRQALLTQNKVRFKNSWPPIRAEMNKWGMGPEFVIVIDCQVASDGIPAKSTVRLLVYFGV